MAVDSKNVGNEKSRLETVVKTHFAYTFGARIQQSHLMIASSTVSKTFATATDIYELLYELLYEPFFM